MSNYRLLIERTGKEYVRITLQHRPKARWKIRQREYLLETGKDFDKKFTAVCLHFTAVFRLTSADIIDARVSYGGMSWAGAALNEVKLMLEGYVWRKRMKRVKKQAIILHTESGSTQHTRRKYWVMTDYHGNPMLMNSRLKNKYKAKGWYSKAVDALALDAECLFNTDALYV